MEAAEAAAYAAAAAEISAGESSSLSVSKPEPGGLDSLCDCESGGDLRGVRCR